MKKRRSALYWTLGLLVAGLGLALSTGIARADRVVNANEPIVVSDDVTNITKEVQSASGDAETPAAPADSGDEDVVADDGDGDGGPGNGNDDNRSGLGDGTNPGQGDGRDNSPNEGTENPNNAPEDRGPDPDRDRGERGR
jgi:hypothetical protein